MQVWVCKKSFCDLHAAGKLGGEACRKLMLENFLVGIKEGVFELAHAILERKDNVRKYVRSLPRRKSHYSSTSNPKREKFTN